MACLHCCGKPAMAVKGCESGSGVRLNLTFLSCPAAGVFYIMWHAGIVSAAPVQLMSDHVFLGASLASVLGAEAVLLRLHLGRRAAVPRRHPAEHPLLWAGALLPYCLLGQGSTYLDAGRGGGAAAPAPRPPRGRAVPPPG